jgi:hypothetical protein
VPFERKVVHLSPLSLSLSLSLRSRARGASATPCEHAHALIKGAIDFLSRAGEERHKCSSSFPHVVRVEGGFQSRVSKEKKSFLKKCFGTFCPQLIGPGISKVGPTAHVRGLVSGRLGKVFFIFLRNIIQI